MFPKIRRLLPCLLLGCVLPAMLPPLHARVLIVEDFTLGSGRPENHPAEVDQTGLADNTWHWGNSRVHIEHGSVISSHSGEAAQGAIAIPAPSVGATGIVEARADFLLNTSDHTGVWPHNQIDWVGIGFLASPDSPWMAASGGSRLWALMRPDGRWSLFQNGTSRMLVPDGKRVDAPGPGYATTVALQYNPSNGQVALFIDGSNVSGWIATEIRPADIGAVGFRLNPRTGQDRSYVSHPRAAHVEKIIVTALGASPDAPAPAAVAPATRASTVSPAPPASANETAPASLAANWRTPAWFGAKGDGATDDSAAIQAALNSNYDIAFDNVTYLLKKPVTLTRVNNKRIDFGHATIIKADNENWTFRLVECDQLLIEGGRLITQTPPVANAKSPDAHAFMIGGSTNLTFRNIHINGSAQMGICIMGSINVMVENCTIENCFRDGIYSHYSANLRYLNNRLQHIKDDALSLHDYGLDNQKNRIRAAGYSQAGRSIISGNTVRNAYQGIASVGAQHVTITDNIIENTVNAGICAFNTDRSFVGSQANVSHILIANNQTFHTNKDTEIMGKTYENGLPDCTARAAITVQSQGHDHMYPTATRRLSNVVITGNLSTDSGTEGIFVHHTDNVTVTGNTVINANANNVAVTSAAIEVISSTGLLLAANNIIDARPAPLHRFGILLTKTEGRVTANHVSGFSARATEIRESKIEN